MATHSERDSAVGPESAFSSSQAQAALADLDTDRAKLAERVVTPWWYHPILGAILAAIVAGYALPLGYELLVLIPGLLAMVLLVRVYARRHGVAVTSSFGPRTRRLQIAVGVIAGISLASAFVLSIAGAPAAWTLLPVVVVFVGIILIGRRYDEALRSELAHHEGQPHHEGQRP